MIDPRYESRIRSGEPIEKVVEERAEEDAGILIDAINVWVECTPLIRPNESQDAVEHLQRVLPDCVDDGVLKMIESESKRRAMLEAPRESLDIGSCFGPTLNDGKGRYRIDELIGEGAQGSVYRAVDRKFRTVKRAQVAIKIHKRIDAIRSVRVQSIDHPNVVRVHDHDIDLHGSPTAYIVYEYLDGQTLEEWVDANEPSMQEIVEILKQICRGVQAIHTLPIVHRDLKPSNIIMTNGRPVIADFGIATDAHEDQSVAGSPLTMAPEQLGHDADSTLVDIYAIGAAAFFMFVKKYPNGQRESDALSHLASKDDIDCSMIPIRVRPIVRKCLARSPMDRYQSAGEVRAAFDDVMNFRSTGVPHKQFARRFVLFVRRNLIPVGSASILLAIIITAMLTTIINQREQLEKTENIKMANEAMKNSLQMSIIDARLRHEMLDPATYWTIVELSQHVPDWEIWASAAIVRMDGDLELREVVEDRTRDLGVSRITAGYWWWLLAKVERAAGRPEEEYRASFRQAVLLLESKLGGGDPLVGRVVSDMNSISDS